MVFSTYRGAQIEEGARRYTNPSNGGEVRVSLIDEGGAHCRLVVDDDGVGMVADAA